MTKYVVLKKHSPPEGSTATASASAAVTATGWLPFASPIEAVSSEAAIRQAAEKNGAGEYVAVPARSWAPQKVTVEQKAEVKFA